MLVEDGVLVEDWAAVIGGSGGSAAGVGEGAEARGAAAGGGVVLDDPVLDEPDEAAPVVEPPGSGGVIWNSELVPWPAETVCARSPVEGRTDAERTIIPAVAIEASARMVKIRVWRA